MKWKGSAVSAFLHSTVEEEKKSFFPRHICFRSSLDFAAANSDFGSGKELQDFSSAPIICHKYLLRFHHVIQVLTLQYLIMNDLRAAVRLSTEIIIFIGYRVNNVLYIVYVIVSVIIQYADHV